MSHKKKIIILTSRDNFVWTSMQEIIPMIEDVWGKLCAKNNYQCVVINVDEKSPTSHLPDLLSSDLIVVTCFNTRIARSIKIIREKMKIDTRLFFYLHGLATIAMWPLHRFEILSLMNSSDVFIGTCEGDITSLNLAFSNAHSVKIPFTINNLTNVNSKTHEVHPFVYIGRISPQKNLDKLIDAYSQLDKQQRSSHPLFLYGTEDHLGYPNMGIKEDQYLEKLKQLVSTYQLENTVVFKGFVDRLKIQEELGIDYTFVSPSTHSDENFGMAAFRALLTGVSCILTDWGGHSEFEAHFSGQIHYVRPSLEKSGPAIPLKELKKTLEHKNSSTVKKNFPHHFSAENIIRLLEKEMDHSGVQAESLKVSVLAQNVFKQQEEFEKMNQIERCFTSFEDPAFKAFFKAYSGQNP